MNFDAQDIIDVNAELLEEAAALTEPEFAVLLVVATWGRGADPSLIKGLEPYRCGLGFNGSVVARVPREQALAWLPESLREQVEVWDPKEVLPVCSTVFKQWWAEPWPLSVKDV